MEINILVSFISGIIIGISPCIFLITSVFGTSLVLIQEKSKYLKIVGGLISGIILAYITVSILLFYLISFFDFFFFFRYIFAGTLIFIGIWQLVESKKEKSLIYQTPSKVKLIMKSFIEKNSGFYAFIVGIIFIFIKLPCMATLYSALIYNVYSNAYFILCLVMYFVGMLIPIMLLFTLIRLGLESSRVNEIRLKYRHYIRIISALTLIILAIYLLIF
jgi:cytochrome c biogenesis protein CcdA